MKPNPAIKVDFKDFLFEGKFGGIKTGQTKKFIIKNFSTPDDESDMGNDVSIWRFGNIELHFDKEMLFLIWCDNLPYIKSTKAIKLDKTFLTSLLKLDLSNAQRILNKQIDSKIYNYSVKFDIDLETAIIKIKNSGVCLHFESQDVMEYIKGKLTNFNHFKLIAFGLSDKKYDTFDRNF